MAYRQRLYPYASQVGVLEMHCSHARFVWNLGLEQRTVAWKWGHRVSVYEQKRSLTEARQDTWLGEGASVVQQQALFDLDRAFRNWWSNPSHFRRPSWRRRGVHEGFAIRDLRVEQLNNRWGRVLVTKLGWVRFRLSRTITEIRTATSARVTLDRAGRWWVSFTAPQPDVPRTETGAAVGLDMGVAHTVTTSDGDHLDMSALLSPGEARRKRCLERRLARQVRGSKRRSATKTRLARLRAREADRRKDWIEQTTTGLVRDYDLIVIEDLAVKDMTRSARGSVDQPGRNVQAKAGLNREITSRAWGLFRRRLEDSSGSPDETSTSAPSGVKGLVA